MSFALKRRKPEPMGVKEPTVIRCEGHLKWVRGFACAVVNQKGAHECFGKIEAAHVRTNTDGGRARPATNELVSLEKMMKEDTVLTTTSSTPPSDAEVLYE